MDSVKREVEKAARSLQMEALIMHTFGIIFSSLLLDKLY